MLPAVVHMNGSVASSLETARHHSVSLSLRNQPKEECSRGGKGEKEKRWPADLVQGLADAHGGALVRAVVAWGLQVAPKNLPAHPMHTAEQSGWGERKG